MPVLGQIRIATFIGSKISWREYASGSGKAGQQLLGLGVELLLGVAFEEGHQFGRIVLPERFRAHTDAAPKCGQTAQEVGASLQFGRLDSRECLF